MSKYSCSPRRPSFLFSFTFVISVFVFKDYLRTCQSQAQPLYDEEGTCFALSQVETSDVNSWNSIQLALEVQVLKSVFQGSCPPRCQGSSCLLCSNDDICTKVNLGFDEWKRKTLDHNNPNSDLNSKGERDRLLVDESRHRCLRGFSDQRWLPPVLLRFGNWLLSKSCT